jgi:hypothetical protein
MVLGAQPARAFCGFYLGKADSQLYNQASQVAIARDGNQTVLTMANDYQGELEDFALVVPVPTVLQPHQVKVIAPEILQRLDSYSAPRLVEYYDQDPCSDDISLLGGAGQRGTRGGGTEEEFPYTNTKVIIEAQFTVGEYDILILSAEESNALTTWLTENDYQLPPDAAPIIDSYLKQGLKFFVAKVNLDQVFSEQFNALRPLQISYESRRFMLPIRLGMVNSTGVQDLIIYLMAPQGQAELTNYRTLKMPSNVEVSEFVEQEFGEFYQAVFAQAYSELGQEQSAFVEYAWNMANCDPCAAEPLNRNELEQAGVFWLPEPSFPEEQNSFYPVFLTRMHVRYTRDKFPEDLQFQFTNNDRSYQARYVVVHPYRGPLTCSLGPYYVEDMVAQQQYAAETVSTLTGWDLDEILPKVNFLELDGNQNQIDLMPIEQEWEEEHENHKNNFTFPLLEQKIQQSINGAEEATP